MIRERVNRLLKRLAQERQFPTQGRTLFIDLERREVRSAYAPKRLVDVFLGGRGMNMFYLPNLLDPSLDPLSPEVPRVYGAGIATGIIPSASRGELTAGAPGVGIGGVMAGPKSLHAGGGGGAKMGSLTLKAIVIKTLLRLDYAAPARVPPTNRDIARQFMNTGVGKILHERGTPFLYKPSRQIWAMATKNNQETVWVDALDSENFDPFRPDMNGCFRCPVNCRPMNDVTSVYPDDPDLAGLVRHVDALGYDGQRYLKGDGPEYVTVGKLGPNIGMTKPQVVIYLNNICNDLGLDTSATGGNLSWAMDLYQRGLISKRETGGLDLTWGNARSVAELLFLTAMQEGFGRVIAAGSGAVDDGYYPPEALKYRMTVKRTMQSDPHDARILKAFALGLAVATRGFDHLRNRVTLEINARINDSPEYKTRLYGGARRGEPHPAQGQERAG